MHHKERFLNALKLKPMNELSHGDVMIHDAHVAQLVHKDLPGDCGNALEKWMCEIMTDENYLRHKRAREFLGFDWIHVFPREPLNETDRKQDGHVVFSDVWGMESIFTEDSTHVIKKPIESENDITKYEFPDVDDFDFCNVKRWIDDGCFAVAPQLDIGFFKISQLTGFEEYMYYITSNQSEMYELMEKSVEFEIKMADRLINLGADVIWLSDDNCYNDGPFISPKSLYEFDFKYTKRIVEYIHSRGVPVIMHCCGNLNYTVEHMIGTGVDAIQGFQPTAHNDIYEMKQKYGSDICLIGNIDINELMPHGSPCDIADKVKEMIERLFYDQKGWVLSTTNLISLDTPIENAITMHLLAESYKG